jgi:hypothetical protein
VKIRTEKKSLEMRAILGKNLKEPPIYLFIDFTAIFRLFFFLLLLIFIIGTKTNRKYL